MCGFPFAILVAKGVRPAWCPSCGVEFTCSSVEVEPNENALNLDNNTITKPNELSDQTNLTNENIVTKNNNIDQNINTPTQANYCNDNSLCESAKRCSVTRRWRILFTSVSVQVIALLMLPIFIFSTATNGDLGINDAGIDTDININVVNPDLPKTDLTQFHSDDLHAITYDNNAQTNPIIAKHNTTIASKNADGSVRAINDDTTDYNSGGVVNYSYASPLPQPENQSTDNIKSVVNKKNETDKESENLNKMASNDDHNQLEIFSLLSDKKNGDGEVDSEVNGEVDGEIEGENEVDEEEELLSYELRLERARLLLEESGRHLAVSPERSLRLAIQAIKRYKELGQDIPKMAQWILGRAYVMQRWGDALVENISNIENMSISSDGQWLWCRCNDDTVWIWNILRSKTTLGGFKLESDGLRIVKLVFTPDLRFAIGIGVDGLVRVWNMELSDPASSVAVLNGRVSNPVDSQISPDGRWLVVSGVVGGVGQGNDSVDGAIGEVNGSGAVWLWDLNSIKDWESFCVNDKLDPVILRGHSKPIRVVQISDDSSWLVTGSEDATARIYNLRSTYTGSEQIVLKGHKAGIMSAVFSVKGGWLATGSQDNTVRVWRLSGSKNPPDSIELRGHIGWVSSLATDDSGERLVSGSFDKTVRIWQIAMKNFDKLPQQEPVVIQTDQGSVKQLLLTRNGKILISLGGDFSLRLWGVNDGGDFDLRNTLLVRNRLLPITNAVISPDDQYLIFNYVNQKEQENSGIRLFQLQLDDLLKSAEEL
jgi:WD40 repeat protein